MESEVALGHLNTGSSFERRIFQSICDTRTNTSFFGGSNLRPFHFPPCPSGRGLGLTDHTLS